MVTVSTEEIRRGTVLVGRYKVRRRLGAGGMATVFLAEDTKLGRDVAIKRLHTDAPKASLTRFKREAKLGAALNHPNLVSVYDTMVTEDQDALIVMEYVPGESLADIAARGAVRPEQAVPILRSVGEALDHAHAQDVVHRDVKPANVLVREDGFVKLADLGIARAVGATQLTGEGSVIGTLPYMSPERMRGPGAGGPESDVYALAAVAYELLSGEPPRDTASTEAMTDEQQAHFEERLAGPPAAARVLQRGLDPNPSRRPVTATRLVDDLDSALAGGEAAETVAGPVRPGHRNRRSPEGHRADRPRRGAPAAAPHRPRAPGPSSPGTREEGRRPQPARRSNHRDRRLAGDDRRARAGCRRRGRWGVELGGETGAAKKDSGQGGTTTQQQETTAEEAAAPVAEQPPTTDGVALNDQGFALLQGGDYEGAIPVLEDAVAALEGSSDELTYNYALFNLGQALNRAGRPDEAIPILEQRLQYPDQTDEVQAELDSAYQNAGVSPGGGEGGDED